MDYSKFRMFKAWLENNKEIDKAKYSDHLTPVMTIVAIVAIILNLIFG